MTETADKKVYLIGIAGGSASGKTYFLRSIREAFNEEQVCIISQDNYYKPAEMQELDEKGVINFDLPQGIDVEAFTEDIKMLARSEKVVRQEYTFNQPGVEGGMITLMPAPVIVVEGLFIFYFKEIKRQLDLKIFMDSRDDIKLYRRLERDAKERGIPTETILYQWHEHVYPAYRQFLLPYRDEADVIITNNYSVDKGLELVIDHVHVQLLKTKQAL